MPTFGILRHQNPIPLTVTSQYCFCVNPVFFLLSLKTKASASFVCENYRELLEGSFEVSLVSAKLLEFFFSSSLRVHHGHGRRIRPGGYRPLLHAWIKDCCWIVESICTSKLQICLVRLVPYQKICLYVAFSAVNVLL